MPVIASVPARRRMAQIGATLALVGLVGCSNGGLIPPSPTPTDQASDPSGPTSSAPPTNSAEATAQNFAAALTSGDFSGVLLDAQMSAESAATELERVISHVTSLKLTASVESIVVADDSRSATAGLLMDWSMDDESVWTYGSTLTLHPGADAGGGWGAVMTPSAIEPSLVEGGWLGQVPLSGVRGKIVDQDGNMIVGPRDVVNVGINKPEVPAGQLDALARQIAQITDIDADSYVNQVNAAGDLAFVVALTIRQSDMGNYQALQQFTPGQGVLLQNAQLPLAPTRSFARALLGQAGEPTAEMIENSDGAIGVGDIVGLSGLQRDYDAVLRGEPGFTIHGVSPTVGVPDRILYTSPAESSPDVVLTLDLDIQQAADDVLASIQTPSALVAVQPSTGAVLAVASGPGSQGWSTATLGQYAPGSTFKVASALGLLRTGLTPDSVLPCTSSVTVDGRPFRNYPNYPQGQIGDISMRVALANSCNTAFISQHERLNQADLAAAAASLGIGQAADLGIDWYRGSVPSDSTGTVHAASLIGQGDVLVSPLAMAIAAAYVARGGPVTPSLVLSPDPRQTPEADGADQTAAASSSAASTGPAPTPLTASEAEALRSMMRSVVTEGSGSALTTLPGEVMAKTGTAEYGTDDPPKTHAWMIAIDGDLAVAVFIEGGDSGSHVAGPVMADFLSRVAGS